MFGFYIAKSPGNRETTWRDPIGTYEWVIQVLVGHSYKLIDSHLLDHGCRIISFKMLSLFPVKEHIVSLQCYLDDVKPNSFSWLLYDDISWWLSDYLTITFNDETILFSGLWTLIRTRYAAELANRLNATIEPRFNPPSPTPASPRDLNRELVEARCEFCLFKLFEG